MRRHEKITRRSGLLKFSETELAVFESEIGWGKRGKDLHYIVILSLYFPQELIIKSSSLLFRDVEKRNGKTRKRDPFSLSFSTPFGRRSKDSRTLSPPPLSPSHHVPSSISLKLLKSIKVLIIYSKQRLLLCLPLGLSFPYLSFLLPKDEWVVENNNKGCNLVTKNEISFLNPRKQEIVTRIVANLNIHSFPLPSIFQDKRWRDWIQSSGLV